MNPKFHTNRVSGCTSEKKVSGREVKLHEKIGIKWKMNVEFCSDSKCGVGRTEGRNSETVEEIR